MAIDIKKAKLFGGVLLLNLLFAEIALAAIYFLNPFGVFSFLSYSTAFDRLKIGTGLGWESYGNLPRPDSNSYSESCAAVFGDSFTHADEVDDDQAWTAISSSILNCKVENFGTGGYGTDQALLKASIVSTDADVIYLGVYQEMLRRNLAASWLFYDSNAEATLKPYFSRPSYDLVPVPTEADSETLRQHHREDRFADISRIQFPYAWFVGRNAYYRVNRWALNDVIIEPRHTAYFDEEALDLQKFLMLEFVKLANKNGKTPGFVFFPTPEQSQVREFHYSHLKEWASGIVNELCIVDPGVALAESYSGSEQGLRAPQGHFNANGNRIIAGEFGRQHAQCTDSATR